MDDSNTHDEFILAELRCAWLRAELVAHEIKALAQALRSGVVTSSDALMIMIQEGIVGWCSPRLEDLLQQAEQEAQDKLWEARRKNGNESPTTDRGSGSGAGGEEACVSEPDRLGQDA